VNLEVVLFWAVAAGFLVADNLLLIPSGGDFLRFGRSGVFRYEPGSRLEARGRDLVFLNPLNLFHRAAITETSLGPVAAAQLRKARRAVRSALPALNTFSWIGYLYLASVIMLACVSFKFSFESVLLAFLCVHAFFWLMTTALLALRREALSLTRYQVLVYTVEALCVPAYTINLGKRLWYGNRLNLPALTLGLRSTRFISDESRRELYVHQLRMRLEDVEWRIGSSAREPSFKTTPHVAGTSTGYGKTDSVQVSAADTADDLQHQLREARACLKI